LKVYAQATTEGDRTAAQVIDDHFADVVPQPETHR